jgi:DNA-directed RNA polymerase specialized sigma24 family protein
VHGTTRKTPAADVVGWFNKKPGRRRFPRLVRETRAALLEALEPLLESRAAAEEAAEHCYLALVSAAWRERFPPRSVEDFIERCRDAVRGLKNLEGHDTEDLLDRKLGIRLDTSLPRGATESIALDFQRHRPPAALDPIEEEIARQLGSLPEHLRNAVELRLGGLTAAEISETLGLVVARVEARLRKAHRRLEARLSVEAAAELLPRLEGKAGGSSAEDLPEPHGERKLSRKEHEYLLFLPELSAELERQFAEMRRDAEAKRAARSEEACRAEG